MDGDEVQRVSAKSGIGIEELLAAVINTVPPPTGDPDETLQAMVFRFALRRIQGRDHLRSHHEWQGFQGAKRSSSFAEARFTKYWKSANSHRVNAHANRCKLGKSVTSFAISNRSIKFHIGDTVSVSGDNAAEPLAGYHEPKRMVYCGLYPSDGQDVSELREALEKLSINDPSFEFEPESSDALGFGFRCGFLGLLHMEIVQQRLEQESDVDLVQTAPNVDV